MDWPFNLRFLPIGGLSELLLSLAAGMLNCECYVSEFIFGRICIKFLGLSQWLFRKNVG